MLGVMPSLSCVSLQLPAAQCERGALARAVAVGGAGHVPGAGHGRGLPPLHPQPLPPQHHLRSQPLAAAGPARHRQHAHMDFH